MNSNKLSVKEGSWQQLGALCEKLRLASLSAAELNQLNTQLDATSKHLLLVINNQPVACARLTAARDIEALAILPRLKNQGLEEQLPKLVAQLKQAKPSHQLEAKAQQKASSLKNFTHLTEENLIAALIASEPLMLEGSQQVNLALNFLINRAAKFFYLQANRYQGWLNEEQLRKLAALARGHSFAEVRFLFNETLSLTQNPSTLVQIYQRASSNFAICQAPATSQPTQAKLLIDEKYLLVWPNPNDELALLYPENNKEAFMFASDFKEAWPRATQVKGLHQLNI